jgi:hypothetical protein
MLAFRLYETELFHENKSTSDAEGFILTVQSNTVEIITCIAKVEIIQLKLIGKI